jgi:hypothetical protein
MGPLRRSLALSMFTPVAGFYFTAKGDSVLWAKPKEDPRSPSAANDYSQPGPGKLGWHEGSGVCLSGRHFTDHWRFDDSPVIGFLLHISAALRFLGAKAKEIQNYDRQRTAISQSDLEPGGNKAPDGLLTLWSPWLAVGVCE